MTRDNTTLFTDDNPADRGRRERMSGKTLRVDIAARGIATVTLNRPEKGNPYNSEMLDELAAEFARLEADSRVRVVLLRGEGKHFCVGADLIQEGRPGSISRASPVKLPRDARRFAKSASRTGTRSHE